MYKALGLQNTNVICNTVKNNLYIRTKILRTIRLKSHNSFGIKLFLFSKLHQQPIGMTPEVLTDHFSPPRLHPGQSILLNAHSLKTFASLTSKNGSSYIRVFTVS